MPYVKDAEIRVRVPQKTYDWVAQYAREHGETVSEAVRTLLIAGLDRRGLRDDVSRAVREVVPQAVTQAVAVATAERDAGIRRAVVAATVAALSKAQGLGAADEQALLQRLLG